MTESPRRPGRGGGVEAALAVSEPETSKPRWRCLGRLGGDLGRLNGCAGACARLPQSGLPAGSSLHGSFTGSRPFLPPLPIPHAQPPPPSPSSSRSTCPHHGSPHAVREYLLRTLAVSCDASSPETDEQMGSTTTGWSQCWHRRAGQAWLHW